MTQDVHTLERSATRLVARANAHDLGFWTRHPDVIEVRSEPTDEPDSVIVIMTLRGFEEDVSPAKREQKQVIDRKPDIEIGFDGWANDAFWSRLPEVERLDFYEDLDGDPEAAPHGWWHARIWLAH